MASRLIRPTSPGIEAILHFFGRQGIDELYQSSHLLTDGILLLIRHDNARVRCTFRPPLGMKAAEVTDVE